MAGNAGNLTESSATMSENTTAPVAVATAEAPARKGKQVSTTLTLEKFDALEDYRWTVRKKMPEVVAEALEDYFAKHKIGEAKPAK
jgi:hypothetical protein